VFVEIGVLHATHLTSTTSDLPRQLFRLLDEHLLAYTDVLHGLLASESRHEVFFFFVYLCISSSVRETKYFVTLLPVVSFLFFIAMTDFLYHS
jgi:hypothetical protein